MMRKVTMSSLVYVSYSLATFAAGAAVVTSDNIAILLACFFYAVMIFRVVWEDRKEAKK